MANAETLKKVKEIVRSDETRRFVVVSAPGKRNKDDVKVTDALYKCYEELIEKGDCHETFAVIRKRFTDIATELGLSVAIKDILDETEKEIIEKKDVEFTASRGEYLSAIVTADYLGYDFIDAKDMVRFDSEGKLNEDYTDDKVKTKLKNVKNAVIPGFYGKNSEGKIKTFSRGGSDITGSIIARGVKADLYENWTDVSGFLICDPRIVPDCETIKQVTYKELRELSYMGASVLHSEAIFPVMRGRIPINIRNTFKPQDEGTMIVPNERYVSDADSVITGIAGKKHFTVLSIEKSLMNSEVGFIRKVLSVIEHHGICVEHVPSGIDTLSVILASDQLKDGVLSDIVNEIRENVSPEYIHVIENISLIATVGHGMTRRSGTAAKIFKALAESGINVRMIDQGSSELNIIIGVADSDYEKCIRAVYDAFVK